MSDVTEFLLARISEDEAQFAVDADEVAAALRPDPNPMWQGDDAYVVLLHARMLAECEAKRRRVKALNERAPHPNAVPLLRKLLALEALPYAEHPSYDESWKP